MHLVVLVKIIEDERVNVNDKVVRYDVWMYEFACVDVYVCTD